MRSGVLLGCGGMALCLVQQGLDRHRIGLDQRQKNAGGRVRMEAILLPIPHSAHRNAIGLGEGALRQLGSLTDRLHIRPSDNMPARAIALGLGDGIGEARHNAVEIFSLHRNASFNAAVIRLNAFSCASVNVASALLWYGKFRPLVEKYALLHNLPYADRKNFGLSDFFVMTAFGLEKEDRQASTDSPPKEWLEAMRPENR